VQWDDQIKEDEMGGACNTHGDMKIPYKILVEKPEGTTWETWMAG
jgi:hypothetical protein